MATSPRDLAYKDRFVWELEEAVSARFADFDNLADRYIFPDLTTQVNFVLSLNQTEWTKLYTAVLTGADLSYPNEAHNVEYLFLQMLDVTMADLCAVIADCIENSSATQSALREYLAGEGMTGGAGDPNAPMSAGILGGNLLPEGYICTDDASFGMALAVVDSIHDATTEVLQAIEILTNPLELAAELADNAPGIGLLAAGADAINWIQDTAKEEYDLAWSTTVRDELACLLWCDFKGACSLSFDNIWDVYLGAADASPPEGDTLSEWLQWLFLLPFTAALSTAATISMLGLLAMRYGGSFGEFSLGIRSLSTVIALSADDTSSDWSVVCDACPTTWCHEYTGSELGSMWELVFASTGSFDGNQWNAGIREQPADQWSRSIEIKHDFGLDVDVTDIEFVYDLVKASSILPDEHGEEIVDHAIPTTLALLSHADSSDGDDQTFDWSGTVTTQEIRLNVRASKQDSTPPGGSSAIKSITIRGTGTPPVEGGNC